MEINQRRESGEAVLGENNGEQCSQKCSNTVKKEICIQDADGNGVDRRALLFHIFGDGLTKRVMTILEI